MKKEKDWFKLKKYPHIGYPLSANDRKWVKSYVTDDEKVKNHGFFPFIHRSSIKRKYRKEIDKATGLRSEFRHAVSKPRELYYANHLDSCIYSYYAQQISESYEQKLNEYDLQNVVTAYRRIRINPSDEQSNHKSSADFAAEVFSFILKSKQQNLAAITFDIKGFFDNLCHSRLKKSWYEILDSKTLPPPEYNIYKNITNFSFINEKQLFREFKDEIITESKTRIRINKKIKKIHYLRNQRAIAFCKLTDLDRIKKKGLIISNGRLGHSKRSKGIPQGSPLALYWLMYIWSILIKK